MSIKKGRITARHHQTNPFVATKASIAGPCWLGFGNRSQLYILKAQLIRRRVPAEGIEPTHPCEYWILSPARLPVPPRRRFRAGSETTEIVEGLQAARWAQHFTQHDGLPGRARGTEHFA